MGFSVSAGLPSDANNPRRYRPVNRPDLVAPDRASPHRSRRCCWRRRCFADFSRALPKRVAWEEGL